MGEYVLQGSKKFWKNFEKKEKNLKLTHQIRDEQDPKNPRVLNASDRKHSSEK